MIDVATPLSGSAAAVPRTGSPPDVGRLFDLHARTLRAAMYALTGSREAADEIVQETFLLAWKRQASLVDGPAMKGWLYRTAYHLAQHYWRGNKRLVGARDRLARDETTAERDAEAVSAQRQRGEQVRACISTLPVQYREVFVLSGSADLEGTEIASILEIPVNTVWTRLHRARLLFKERWGGVADGGWRPEPEGRFDLSALWAWLVRWLPPEILPLVGGERRLAEHVRGWSEARGSDPDAALDRLGRLAESERIVVILGQVLGLAPEAVAEVVDRPVPEVVAALKEATP